MIRSLLVRLYNFFSQAFFWHSSRTWCAAIANDERQKDYWCFFYLSLICRRIYSGTVGLSNTRAWERNSASFRADEWVFLSGSVDIKYEAVGCQTNIRCSRRLQVSWLCQSWWLVASPSTHLSFRISILVVLATSLIFLDLIEDHPALEWVGCCNELNASYAADGYARVSQGSIVFSPFGQWLYWLLCPL